MNKRVQISTRKELAMLIMKHGKIEIWSIDNEYYVYGATVSGDPIVCPSIGMAREVAVR